MLRITLQMDDTVIAADIDPLVSIKWQVIFASNFNGQRHRCELDSVQLGAILAMTVGLGEEYPNPEAMGVSWLYDLARDTLDAVECPDECWPMP